MRPEDGYPVVELPLWPLIDAMRLRVAHDRLLIARPRRTCPRRRKWVLPTRKEAVYGSPACQDPPWMY